MTTVSLVEIKSPVSLRSCGTSISSLVHRRTRLQCFSPDKLAAAYKARTPDMKGRISVSPKLLGLEGTQLVLSPAESPVPRQSVTPYSGRQSRFAYDEFSSSGSLSELSDIDTDGEQDREQWDVDDKQPLFVVGSRQKLHGPYDVPNLKADIAKTKSTCSGQNMQDSLPAPKKSSEHQLNREESSSPDNPPPSPINYRPSLEGFVVGGQKLLSPEKSTTRQGTLNNSRDFVPGFVKHPLHHCNKCEYRVVEEQQTEAALQRRRSILLQSRISAHKYIETPIDAIQSVGSRLAVDSPMLQGSLGGFPPEMISPNPSSYYNKTFTEIYMEKKRLKEEKDKEMAEEKKRFRETRRHEKGAEKKARMARKNNEKDGVKMKSHLENVVETTQHGISDELVVKPLEKIYRSTSAYEDSADVLIPRKTTATANKSLNDFLLEYESPLKPLPTVKRRCRSSCVLSRTPEVEKLQIRRCWSGIWPFPGGADSNKRTEDDIVAFNFGEYRNKSGITPFYPLNRSPAIKSSESTIFSCESLTSNQSNHASGADDAVMLQTSLPVGLKNGQVKVPSPEDYDRTTTKTVIVPSPDTQCNQWISFGAGNEPVLNDTSDVDDGCDTFLKRLQRTTLCNTIPDPSLPTGQEFCFEAVVDKRYNRWKRHRRKKKKDGEHHRVVCHLETESSDENDEQNFQVERILDRMYDQIHGPPPLTANGTRDTPRLRNRRRRQELHVNQLELALTSTEPTVTNYDASSEWTSSDRDSVHLSSNSGSGHCYDKLNSVTIHKPVKGKSSDDLCYWPFIEQYKQEMMMKIKNTSSEQLEAMDQKEWLPDITSHYSKKSSRTSHQSEGDNQKLTDNEASIKKDQSRIGERTNATITDASNQSSKSCEKSVQKVVVTKNTMPNPSIFRKWSRSIQQSPRNSNTPIQSTRLLSRANTSSWDEIRPGKKTARKIGVVEVGQNDLDYTFKPSLRPVTCDNIDLTSATKQDKKSLKDQPKSKTTVNLPALSKTLKSQIVPQTFRKATPFKGRKKPQTPVPGKVATMKQQFTRPKTQPFSVKKRNKIDQEDPNLLFRDYYLKSLYKDRLRINSHIGPHTAGKTLMKTITADQLNIGSKKNRTDDDKLSDLSFTRSFTFSMFDLPEVYKMYNSDLLQRAQEELIETSD